MVSSKQKVIYMNINEQFLSDDDFDVFKVISPLWWNVSIHDGEEEYEDGLRKFSLAQRYIFAIVRYDTEVNIGGHYQFYNNSTGIVWEDVMKGFEVIGATKCAKIIKKSIELFYGCPSKIKEERWKQMDNQSFDDDTFDELDDAYYNGGSIELELLRSYIKNNANDFYFSGKVTVC